MNQPRCYGRVGDLGLHPQRTPHGEGMTENLVGITERNCTAERGKCSRHSTSSRVESHYHAS